MGVRKRENGHFFLETETKNQKFLENVKSVA